MSACERRIFPEKVMDSVKAEMAKASEEDPVPERMNLSPSMKNAQLGDSTVVELEFDFDQKLVKEVDVLRGREMLKRLSGPHGSVCLVKQAFGGFGVLGIIKETGVDDLGLVEFEKDYFRYPLFCDKSYSFYQALGDRKVSVKFVLNPISLVSIVCDTYRRITSKGIQGNFKGEGLVQGGIIIFDNQGNPRYAYEEETGEDLPVKDILAAMNAVRREST